MLVVLPAPFTPATRITVGPVDRFSSSRSCGGNIEINCSRTIFSASSALRTFPRRHCSRTSVTSFSTRATPMSARMNFSSISVRNESSICRPGTNSVRTSVLSTAAVFFSAPLSLSRVLEKKLIGGSGFCCRFRLGTRTFSQRLVLFQDGIQHAVHKARRVLGGILLGQLDRLVD